MIQPQNENDRPSDIGEVESGGGDWANPDPDDLVALALRDLESKLIEIQGAIEAILQSRPDLRKSRQRSRPS